MFFVFFWFCFLVLFCDDRERTRTLLTFYFCHIRSRTISPVKSLRVECTVAHFHLQISLRSRSSLHTIMGLCYTRILSHISIARSVAFHHRLLFILNFTCLQWQIYFESQSGHKSNGDYNGTHILSNGSST